MKAALILGMLVWFTTATFAQRPPARQMALSDRIYFGGGGGFGSGIDPFTGFRYTNISVNPLIGYRITEPWSVGVMVNFTYVSFPDVKVSLSQYGVSPFTRYNFGRLFAYAEYSVISVPDFTNTFRRRFDRLPIGLGYWVPLGGRAALNAIALYDVMYNRSEGAFNSPWVFRVFISAGAISF
jgi:hypothetical protein